MGASTLNCLLLAHDVPRAVRKLHFCQFHQREAVRFFRNVFGHGGLQVCFKERVAAWSCHRFPALQDAAFWSVAGRRGNAPYRWLPLAAGPPLRHPPSAAYGQSTGTGRLSQKSNGAGVAWRIKRGQLWPSTLPIKVYGRGPRACAVRKVESHANRSRRLFCSQKQIGKADLFALSSF
jgi:hypothetical protein